MSGKTKERKKGALWDKKPEESGGKGLMDMLRKKKQTKHRNNQTDEETGFGVQRGKDGREEKKKTEQSVTS